MNKQLLNILVCPLCKGKLVYRGSLLNSERRRLICEQDGLVFPVREGIPMLNLFDARKTRVVK